MRNFVVLFVFLLSASFSGVAHAGHWSAPSATTVYMHIAGSITIDGKSPQAGDEVGVFAADGTLVGLHVFDGKSGALYGDLAINGDDPGTRGNVEGAQAEEALSVKVWSAGKRSEYRGDEIKLVSTKDFAKHGYLEPALPLAFTTNAFYGINIVAN